MRISSTVLAAMMAGAARAAYSFLAEDYTPGNFLEKFSFYTGADPTRGVVKYVDRATAEQGGLVSRDGDSLMLAADRTTDLTRSLEGRKSVRLESNRRYTRGLFILDATHMPTGCGTWPAFWTLGDSWPTNGEIDILEGVNDQRTNNMALHTSSGCAISGSGHTSLTKTTNCFVSAPNQATNVGCAIHDIRANSYGDGFNRAQGGLYAMEWTRDFIKIWFWPRGAEPQDIHGANPAPENWGTPAGMFAGACEMDRHFKEHKIVINLTFCGDWAGGTWAQGECGKRAPTCEQFVRGNPDAFKEAYWRIKRLRVFSW